MAVAFQANIVVLDGRVKGDAVICFQMKKSENDVAILSEILLKIDLSFFPKDEFSPTLFEISEKPMLYPYAKEDILDFLNRKKVSLISSTKLMKLSNDFKSNYWLFEKELIEKGFDLLNEDKTDLAELCFRYLIEIGSKSPLVKEELIKIFIKRRDDKNLKWIFENIEEQLNDKTDYHYFKSKVSALKIKYGKNLFSNDQICVSFNKRLNSTTNFNEHSTIYREMSKYLLQEGNYKEAAHKFILSFIAEAQYCFILDQELNSNHFNQYIDVNFIKGRISGFLKKTNYQKYCDKISDLLLIYLSQFPTTDYNELKKGLAELFNQNT